MKKILKLTICMVLAVFLMTSCVFASSFSDIEGHWAKHYIEKMAEKGYVKGYGDGTFLPDAPMTRAEVATVITNVFSLAQTTVGHKVLKDVNETDWFMPYSLGGYLVFPADENATYNFRGNDEITRLEAAHAIIALYNCNASTSHASKMADYETYSSDSFVKKVVSTAVANGIMQGKGETGFEPYSTLTRAELCTLIMRTLEQKGNAEEETIKTLSDFINETNTKYGK